MTRTYSVYGELYLQMTGWNSAVSDQIHGIEYSEQFQFIRPEDGGYHLLIFPPTIAENNKLHFKIYVD